MKRRLLKLGVFLLLGAIVNVAVAWGCAIRSQRDAWHKTQPFWLTYQPMMSTLEFDVGVVITKRFRDVAGVTWAGPFELVNGDEFLRRTPYWSVMKNTRDQALLQKYYEIDVPHDFLCETGAGWPLISFRGAVASQVLTEFKSGLLPTPIEEPRGFGPIDVPCLPIWPGFAINTIFYAAILALLFYAPGKMRRWIRVHRSQCPACGHIIAAGTCANGLCSECGSPLPKGFKPRPDASAQT